jgi:hypothetical protein
MCRENQSTLKSDKNNGTSCEDQYTFLSHLAHFFLEWEMFETYVVEKIKTPILCSITFFPKIVAFMRKCGKILQNRAGHRWQYGACALRAGYKLIICNTYFFHSKNGYANQPQIYVIRTLPVLHVDVFNPYTWAGLLQLIQGLGYGWMNGISIPGNDKRFFSFTKIVRTDSGAHPASCSLGTGSSLFAVRRSVAEVNRWPPSSVEIKDEWSYLRYAVDSNNMVH